MENYIGHRAKIGIILPSTNTAVEYDMFKFVPPGVTWHPARFHIESPDLSSDEAFLNFLVLMRKQVKVAVRDVMTCFPTYIMMGMSAETFWGGQEGNAEFVGALREQIGDLGLTTGANAADEALKRFGAKNISVLTPYQPVGDEQVRMFFGECGYTIKNLIGLKCASATSIADTTESEILEAVRALDGDDVDAIVQVGTNLSTADLFPVMEKYLGKPCISINIANMWHALRESRVNDRAEGLGRLLEEF